MQSRYEFDGNWFADGIDYFGCADICRGKEKCAGFDVWEGNHDCQLFFDEDHYGDGAHQEECFINESFVDTTNRQFSEEEWGQLFDFYDSNSNQIAELDEFRKGWST